MKLDKSSVEYPIGRISPIKGDKPFIQTDWPDNMTCKRCGSDMFAAGGTIGGMPEAAEDYKKCSHCGYEIIIARQNQ